MKGIVKSFRFFWWTMKSLEQWWKFLFRVAETEINVQRDNSRKIFSQKRKSYSFCSRHWVNFFFTFSGSVRQICQNCIQLSLGRFWGRTMFETMDKVSNFFELWAKSLRVSLRSFFQVCHSCNPAVRRIILRKTIFFQKILVFPINFVAPVTFFCFSANKLSKCVKFAIHMYRRKLRKIFLWKMVFLDFEPTNLNFQRKINGTFLKTVAYVSERKIFRKKNFGQLISHHFSILTRKILELSRKFCGRLSKLNSMCQEEHLQSIFLKNNVISFRFFEQIMKFLGQWRNFFIRVAKTVKKCPAEQIKTFS